MPRIFDNIDEKLLPALRDCLAYSDRADFCVGYFNLRGWKALDDFVERWSGGEGNCCRLIVGMHREPEEELREYFRLIKSDAQIDNAKAIRTKQNLVENFRNQLTLGLPTNADEEGLRRLARQIRAKKVVVKLFLRHPLHAKLYLLFRANPVNPSTAYLGSSNLTLSGLSHQGELNIDVLDVDACDKLAKWFEDRWNDKFSIDVSEELAQIIEDSWARVDLIPPYYIYIKMAYHLSEEARQGITEFKIPAVFKGKLLQFQEAAVQIASHHLNRKNGVLIGDVVGLGKTLMATAVARIFEEDYDYETLIICPPNLEKMWVKYREEYGLRGKVLSLGKTITRLPEERRYRLLIIDESHNLRNREGTRYRAIRDYIRENDSKCILLTATPYNKTYLDLSNQLRLFLSEEEEIKIRPEKLLKEIGEAEFIRRHQCSPRSLAAFEKSYYPEDWRSLMRLYLVRRTRSFIIENYAEHDENNGRKYLSLNDGRRYYFPTRTPRTIPFAINEKDTADQYARLFAEDVVATINALRLPRYGLGNYITEAPTKTPDAKDERIIQNLSRAGKRLMGFCRTNLFKRLESSGQAFVESVERHILRNYVYLHALEKNKPIPIGSQGAYLLDAWSGDEDADNEGKDPSGSGDRLRFRKESDYLKQAADIYEYYQGEGKRYFDDWLRADLLKPDLARDLKADAQALLKVLNKCGEWDPARDAKLDALSKLLTKKHPNEKVIVFSQFADTVRYLETQLKAKGINALAGVTGDSDDPTGFAQRFSPVSNEVRGKVPKDRELRVLIATDVLSEGQNLQDCNIVVNFDLPWAIIRLIQRIGRVDRIGQSSEKITCYSFLPADGVEKILRLRARVRERLIENAEVVGTDEAFFEDEGYKQKIVDIYNENAGIFDGGEDGEVDLASEAYAIWRDATRKDPKLEKIIPALPDVAFSNRAHEETAEVPGGVLVYLKTTQDNDALIWVDRNGDVVTEDAKPVLNAAACPPKTVALPHAADHHDLVAQGVEKVITEEKFVGGQLGRPSGARYKTYERLKPYAAKIRNTPVDIPELHRALEDILKSPLKETAKDSLNRMLRSHATDEQLAERVVVLRGADALCVKADEGEVHEPRIICSLGLTPADKQG